MFILTILLLLLVGVQLSLYGKEINFSYYVYRFISVFVFIWVCEIVRLKFEYKHLRYLKASFYFVFFYTLYSAFSTVGHYEFLLIPGTASNGNISPIGTLRAGTFGEGNYLGTYCALITMIFIKNIKIVMMAFVLCVLSFSPIPLVLIVLLLLHVHFLEKKFGWRKIRWWYLFFFLIILAVFPFYISEYIRHSIDNYVNAEEYNLKTSFVERTDFIISGLRMWLYSPIVGCGLGQFPELLSKYATLPHLVLNEDNFRYIANNNIAEILSEQGLIGLAYYIYLLKSISNDFLRKRHVSNIMCLFLLGLTMPSFFQIIIAGFIGILRSNEYKMKMGPENL
ncbi:O-antigen ligase family protein [Chitinophagaceae bacterium LWZ2-11]